MQHFKLFSLPLKLYLNYKINYDLKGYESEVNMNKENADINEILELSLNNCKVKVEHHCKKIFKDQNPKAIEDLKQFIKDQLKANKKEGFIPYDSFECSVNWSVV